MDTINNSKAHKTAAETAEKDDLTQKSGFPDTPPFNPLVEDGIHDHEFYCQEFQKRLILSPAHSPGSSDSGHATHSSLLSQMLHPSDSRVKQAGSTYAGHADSGSSVVGDTEHHATPLARKIQFGQCPSRSSKAREDPAEPRAPAVRFVGSGGRSISGLAEKGVARETDEDELSQYNRTRNDPKSGTCKAVIENVLRKDLNNRLDDENEDDEEMDDGPGQDNHSDYSDYDEINDGAAKGPRSPSLASSHAIKASRHSARASRDVRNEHSRFNGTVQNKERVARAGTGSFNRSQSPWSTICTRDDGYEEDVESDADPGLGNDDFDQEDLVKRDRAPRNQPDEFLFENADRSASPAKGRRASAGRAASLPDSTDFCPGTLDEDMVASSAYASAIETRRAKHKSFRKYPHDIDPTFPSSESEGGGFASEPEPRVRDSSRRRGSPAKMSTPNKLAPRKSLARSDRQMERIELSHHQLCGTRQADVGRAYKSSNSKGSTAKGHQRGRSGSEKPTRGFRPQSQSKPIHVMRTASAIQCGLVHRRQRRKEKRDRRELLEAAKEADKGILIAPQDRGFDSDAAHVIKGRLNDDDLERRRKGVCQGMEKMRRWAMQHCGGSSKNTSCIIPSTPASIPDCGTYARRQDANQEPIDSIASSPVEGLHSERQTVPPSSPHPGCDGMVVVSI